MAGTPDQRGIDPQREALLRALCDGGVRFVLIGGAALESHGQRYETEDVDVTPDRTRANLERLADVLNRLECRLEVDPVHPERAVPLPDDYFTATVLARASVWNLRTVHGKLDLALSPSGSPEGYAQLAKSAERGRVAATSIEVPIAALADVEHSKRIADRAKDRAYLEQVGRLDATQDTSGQPESATAVADSLLRAYARREELHTARASIKNPPRTRRDRVRILAYDLSLEAIDEEIAALEQDARTAI